MCGIKLNEPVALQANIPVASDNTSGPPAVAMLSGHYSNKTVLQTAKVKVVNNKGAIITAKLIFDSGCDCTYVSNKCVNKCKPDWVTRTEVPYSSFGGHTSGRGI